MIIYYACINSEAIFNADKPAEMAKNQMFLVSMFCLAVHVS
jgi:hypothetical protein